MDRLIVGITGATGTIYGVRLLQMLEAESPPKPPAGEWLATFDSYSTDLDAGAATFSYSLATRSAPIRS